MRPSKLAFSILIASLFGFGSAANAQSLYDIYKETQQNKYQAKRISSLQDLLRYQDQSQYKKKKEIEAVAAQARLESLEMYAFNIAIKAAISNRIAEINSTVAKNERYLDAIYNFQPLMIGNRVVPPVITEARGLYNQNSNLQIRLSGVVYDINEQARFSSVAPNWREYLTFPSAADAYDEVVFGTIGFEPKTTEEKRIWVKASQKGWEQGITQANNILLAAMDNLNRDYTGMVRFHQFVKQGKVSMPIIRNYDLYDTNLGQRLLLDEQLLQIEAVPEFITRPAPTAYDPVSNTITYTPDDVRPDTAVPVSQMRPVEIKNAQDAINTNNGAWERSVAISLAQKEQSTIQKDWDTQLETTPAFSLPINQQPEISVNARIEHDTTIDATKKPKVQGVQQDDIAYSKTQEMASMQVKTSAASAIPVQNSGGYEEGLNPNASLIAYVEKSQQEQKQDEATGRKSTPRVVRTETKPTPGSVKNTNPIVHDLSSELNNSKSNYPIPQKKGE